MTLRERLFLESKAWAAEIKSLDRDYFGNLDGLHTPKILWIGSSDSLVHVNEVINADPGEVLVYRNIGNQVHQDDISLMALLEDAVVASKIENIIICGYSHCTGIRDVLLGMDNRPLVSEWLKQLRALYEVNREKLDQLDFQQRERKLAELNIELQIKNLSLVPCIQRAWEKRDIPKLYGWYFDLDRGSLKEIFAMEENHKLKKVASLV
jgi:carbonic anhydrase